MLLICQPLKRWLELYNGSGKMDGLNTVNCGVSYVDEHGGFFYHRQQYVQKLPRNEQEPPLSLTHCVLNMVTFKKYHALLNDRLICRCKYFPKTAMDDVVQRPNLISIYRACL